MSFFLLKNNFLKALTVSSLFVLCGIYVLAGTVFAAPNLQINYQGKLTNASNVAVADAGYQIEFSLYASSTGGTAIWTETRTGVNEVIVENGLFSVMLGSVNPLTGVDFNQTLYLGVTVEADSEMTPRKVLGTVPAAFEANNANTVGGVASTSLLRNDRIGSISTTSASTMLTITQSGTGDILNLFDGGTEVFSVLDGGNVGIGSSSPSAKLTVSGNTFIGGNLTATGTLTVGTLSGLLLGTNGTVSAVSTSSLAIALSDTTGTLSATRGGTGLSTITQNQLLLGGAGNTWTQVATSSLGLSAAFTNSTQFAALLSDETGTGAVVFAGSPLFTGTASFINIAATGTLAISGTTTLATTTISSSTITTLTLNNALAATSGGTGFSTYATGDFIYASGANTLAKRTIGTTGDILSVIGGVPTWAATSTLGFASSFSNSAQLAALLSDETGSAGGGVAVFSLSPTFTGTANFASTTNSGRLTVSGTSTFATTSITSLAVSGASTLATTTISSSTIDTLTLNNALAVTSGGTGATTAAGARTNLGATTVGANIFTLTNPGTLSFLRINADNTVSAVATSTLGIALSDTTGTLGTTRGGTGLSSYSTGDLIYASGANTLANRTIGSTGNILSVVGGVPTWVATSSLGFTNFFTDAGTTTYLTSLTDYFAIGTTSTSSKFTVQGSAGSFDIFNVASSTGVSAVRVLANSNMELTGQLIDAGTTWTARTAAGDNDGWQAVTYGNGLFVAVGAVGDRAMTSPDGINWTARTAAGNNDNWRSVTYGNGLFVAVADSGGDRVMTSPDGVTWTARSAAGNDDSWQGVTYANGLFVAVGDSSGTGDSIITSPDGINWTARSAAGDDDGWNSVTYGNGLFVAVNSSSLDPVMYSSDGVTWATTTAAGNNDAWGGITYGKGLFVAVGGFGDRVMTSPDAINWTARSASGGLQAVTYGNGLFVASGDTGTYISTSPDGINWTARSAAGNNDFWYGITYGNGMFVAVGTAGDFVITSGSINESRLASNNLYQGPTTFMNTLNIGTSSNAAALTIQGQVGNNSLLSIASSTGSNLLTLSSAGNLGLGTTTPGSLLTVAGTAYISGTAILATTTITDLALSGAFRDGLNASGTLGMVLQSVGTSTRWVATSSLGFVTGATTFLGLTDTPSSYAANRLFFTNSGATAVTDSANLTFDGSRLSTLNLAVTGTSTFAGTSTFSGNVGVGTSTPASKLDVWGDLRVGISALPTLFANTTTGRLTIGTTSPSISGVTTERVTVAGGGVVANNPSNLLEVGQFDDGGTTYGVSNVGRYSYVADGADGLEIIDISNPTAPVQVGQFYDGGNSLNITVVGRLVYLADDGDGLEIIDISNPTAPVQVGQFDDGGNAIDVTVVGRYAYVADYADGLEIIDISNPTAPVQVGQFDDGGNSYEVTVVGRYAYLSDGSDGLEIIDISNPTAPVQVGQFDDGGFTNGTMVVGRYAYVADGSDGLEIIDISNPTAPVQVGQFNDGGSAEDVIVAGRYIFMADSNNGLEIIDISSSTAPVQVGQFDDGGTAYDVSIVGRYAYVADGSDGLEIIDIGGSDFSTLFAGQFGATLGTIQQDLIVGNVGTFGGGLNVGSDARVAGMLTISGTASSSFSGINNNPALIVASGNVGIGTSTPSSRLTVAGTAFITGTSTLATTTITDLTVSGAFRDGVNASGTLGMILQSVGTSTRWVATSTLGISGGGATTFLALTDTPSSYTANRVMFTNSGATALTDSANFTFDGTRLATLNLGVSGTSTFAGTSTMATTSITSLSLGQALTTTNGGTGLTSYTTGDLIYASGANTLTNRAIGTTGQILAVQGGVPTWVSSSTLGLSNLFTDAGTTTYLTSLSDNFAIGTTSTSSKLTVQGSSGSLDVFNVASSSGTSLMKILANSNTEISGQFIDRGVTWTARSAAGDDDVWQAVTYGNGRYVAVGSTAGDRVMYSDDGINWATTSAAGNDDGWKGVAYGNGLFVAVGSSGDTVMTSPDGVNWTVRTGFGSNGYEGVTYGNGRFVAVGHGFNEQIATSLDGIKWTLVFAPGNNDAWNSIAYGKGIFVAVADSGDRVMYSSDGLTWATTTAAGNNDTWMGVTYGNGQFVAVANNSDDEVMTSPDGITWTARPIAGVTTNDWESVTYGNGLFVAVADNSGDRLMTSPDGITWTIRLVSGNLSGITYGNGLFVIVSSLGARVITSGYNSNTVLVNNNIYQGINSFTTALNIGTSSTATSTNSAVLSVFGRAGSNLLSMASSTGTNFLTLTGTGNLGLGSSSPNSLLTVIGTAYISGTSTLATSTISNLTVSGTSTLATTTISSSTITTLTLNNALAALSGGTGFNTYSTGDFIYASGANTLAKRTIGSTGNILSVVGGVPTWTATSSLAVALSDTTGTLAANRGGTGVTALGGANTVLYTSSANTIASSSSFTFDGTRLTVPNLNVTGTSTFVGTSTMATTTIVCLALSGAFLDSTSASGTLGMVLQSTGTSTRWVATSTLGLSGGSNFFTDTGATTYLTSLSDNLAIGTTTANEKLTVNGNINLLGGAASINFAGDKMITASSTKNTYTMGWLAGDSITSGSHLIAIGTLALQNASSTDHNIAIGTEAGRYTTTGGGNVFIGPQFAGTNNTTGTGNNFIGYAAGGNSTGGDFNTFMGNQVGNGLISGSSNTYLGAFAGWGLATTSSSVLIGDGAGWGVSGYYAADNLTIIGRDAGYNLETGADNNILIGYRAGNGLTTGANNLIVGYNIEAPSNTASNQLNIGNLIFGTGIDGTGTTLSSGNIGIGSTTPSAKLTVAGTFRATGTSTLTDLTLTGALRDTTNSAGTIGMVLQSTGTSTRWVATSTLGITGGGGGTFLSLTDTPSSYTANRVMFTNSGGSALIDSANFTFDGTRLSTLNLNVTGTSTFVGTTTLATTTINGLVQMGTTSVASRFNLDVGGFNTAGTAGLNRYYTSTNSASGTQQFGELSYSRLNTTGTTTYVGSLFRVEDSTTRGNTVRGLEVQTNRGTNTQGENTALSGFARTFGVRGFTSADAGGVFEPAGGYFETGGTTQGNAIRGYSSTITTASLMSLFQDTSAFSGTGVVVNVGNGSGSFSGKFLDMQLAGVSKFSIASSGATYLLGDLSITATNTDPAANNVVAMYLGANGFASINRSANPAMSLGRSNDGAVLQFYSAGAIQGSVSIAGATVSYNAFTGSHFGLTASTSYPMGTLMELSGENQNYNDDPDSEILYGMRQTTTENSSMVIGSYLSVLEPAKAESTANPTLVMAVGNGAMWVADQGVDVVRGDYLISSNVAGHAERDPQTDANSYIIARASEDIAWDEVTTEINGVKHKRITVFFENFVRPNINLALIASSTVELADIESASQTGQFMAGLFAKLITWFGSAQNGIEDMYANVFNAKERICVDGECLTADDIRNLKGALQSGGSSNPPPSNGGAPGASEPPPAGGGTGDAGGGESDDGESGGGETGDAPDEAPPGAGDGESGGGETGDAPDEAPPGAGDSGGGSEAPPAGGDEGGSGDQGSSGG